MIVLIFGATYLYGSLSQLMYINLQYFSVSIKQIHFLFIEIHLQLAEMLYLLNMGNLESLHCVCTLGL